MSVHRRRRKSRRTYRRRLERSVNQLYGRKTRLRETEAESLEIPHFEKRSAKFPDDRRNRSGELPRNDCRRRGRDPKWGIRKTASGGIPSGGRNLPRNENRERRGQPPRRPILKSHGTRQGSERFGDGKRVRHRWKADWDDYPFGFPKKLFGSQEFGRMNGGRRVFHRSGRRRG